MNDGMHCSTTCQTLHFVPPWVYFYIIVIRQLNSYRSLANEGPAVHLTLGSTDIQGSAILSAVNSAYSA